MKKQIRNQSKQTGKKLQVDVVNLEAEKIGELFLPSNAFGLKANKILVSQVINAYLANQRKAAARTKSRGEVAGSTRKIWAQKGTGRARHGDRRAPIFVGGGVAHGPKGDQNFKQKINKKMKRKALLVVLSEKLRNQSLLAVKGLEKIKPKTKYAQEFVDRLRKKIKQFASKKKVLIVLEKRQENIKRAFANLSSKGIRVKLASQVNVYDLLLADLVVFQPKSVDYFKSLAEKISKG